MTAFKMEQSYLSNVAVMIRRGLIRSLRNHSLYLYSCIIPVIIITLFRYVFGGAIQTGKISYINYILPAVWVVAIGFSATGTALSVNSDFQSGIIDRFRSLPISRTSILTGYVITTLIKTIIAVTVVSVVALPMGFESNVNIRGIITIISILVLYTVTLSWLAVIFGLTANSAEGVDGLGQILWMLPYISSAFVPTENMPGPIRLFAENQPVNPIIQTIRATLLNLPCRSSLTTALLWCFGLGLVFYLIAVNMFSRKMA